MRPTDLGLAHPQHFRCGLLGSSVDVLQRIRPKLLIATIRSPPDVSGGSVPAHRGVVADRARPRCLLADNVVICQPRTLGGGCDGKATLGRRGPVGDDGGGCHEPQALTMRPPWGS